MLGSPIQLGVDTSREPLNLGARNIETQDGRGEVVSTQEFVDDWMGDVSTSGVHGSEGVAHAEDRDEGRLYDSAECEMRNCMDQLLEGDSSDIDVLLLSLAVANLSLETPRSHAQAMQSPNSEKWTEAMETEILALEEYDTWDVVDLPPGRKAIRC